MVFRRSALVLGASGGVAVVLGALVNPVVVPQLSKLPSNTDMTVHYAGTASLVDQTAAAKGDVAGAMKTGVPLTLDRHIHVLSTSGNTAIVADDQTLTITGLPPMPDDHVYAVDRKTVQAGAPPAGKTVEPASGIPIGWPVGPSAHHAYRYYDPSTQTSAPLTYTGSAKVKGRGVLDFQSSVPAAPVKDKVLLATLPTTLPKAVAGALAPLLPKETAALLTPQVLAALPDAIPLAYTATTTVQAGADKAVGLPLEQHLQQKVMLNVALPGQAPIPLLPVLSTDLQLTPASQQYLANKADTAGTELSVVKIVVPVVLVVLGLALLVLAYLKRKPKV
jgi:hypothetical protein